MRVLIFLSFVFLLPHLGYSQTGKPNLYCVKKMDGSKVKGEIKKIGKDTITMLLPEEVKISKAEVKKIFSLDFINDNSDYTINQSAFTLGKGRMRYKTLAGLIHEFKFGVTDHLDIDIGTEVISLIDNAGTTVISGIKYGVEWSKNIRSALSVKYIHHMAGYDSQSEVFITTPITLGNDKNNFSFIPFFIYTFTGHEYIFIPEIAFRIRLSKNISVQNELLYFIDDDVVLDNILFDFALTNNFRLGLGVFGGFDSYEVGAIPSVTMTYIY